MIQRLEERRLFSAVRWMSVSDEGLLAVNGGARDDEILINVDSGVTDAERAGRLLITRNGRTVALSREEAASLTGILVRAGRGNDEVVVNGDRVVGWGLIPHLWPRGGRGSLPVTLPTEIRGGAGDDTLVGGNGNDKVLGRAGRDVLVGEGGIDHLAGGEGDDALYGAAKSNAERVADSRDGSRDRLVGGAGADAAFGDDADVFNGVETIEGRRVELAGTLLGKIIAIGGETTGWALELEGSGDRLELDVRDVREAADALEDQPVVVRGHYVWRNYLERRWQRILRVELIEAAP